MPDSRDELEPGATVGKITAAILPEMREELPDVLTSETTIADAIRRAYLSTKVPFVFIIDESTSSSASGWARTFAKI